MYTPSIYTLYLYVYVWLHLSLLRIFVAASLPGRLHSTLNEQHQQALQEINACRQQLQQQKRRLAGTLPVAMALGFRVEGLGFSV